MAQGVQQIVGAVTIIGGIGPITASSNIDEIDGNPVDVGNGTAGSGTLRVAIASDSTGSFEVNNGAGAAAVNIQDGGNSITIDAAVLPLPTGASTAARQDTGNASLASIDSKITTVNTGAVVISSGSVTVSGTVAATQSGTWTLGANSGVDIGDVTVNNAGGAAAVNIQDGGNTITVDGTVNANITGGTVTTTVTTPTHFINLGANAALNVKAASGSVFSLYCYNANAADRFLQLHNLTTAPTGGETPKLSFQVPSGGSIVIGTDFFTAVGVPFSTGISFAFSTTRNTYTAGSAADQLTTIEYT